MVCSIDRTRFFFFCKMEAPVERLLRGVATAVGVVACSVLPHTSPPSTY
jgi:hypothetical protein